MEEENRKIDWDADDFRDILKDDSRYDERAYAMVLAVFRELVEEKKDKVGGREILERFRDFALDEYGPMAFYVLSEWGVTSCSDVGEIMFLLSEHGRIEKSDDDDRADFIGGYDFRDAFLGPFSVDRDFPQ